MSAGADPVRGRQGPRPLAGNRYERKARCACVDHAGKPKPFHGTLGDCLRCGLPIKAKKE